MGWFKDVVEKIFTADKIKVMKGLLAGFLVIAITGFAPVFESLMNVVSWDAILTGYVSQLYYAAEIVILGFVIFFLGKPLFTMPEEKKEEETITE